METAVLTKGLMTAAGWVPRQRAPEAFRSTPTPPYTTPAPAAPPPAPAQSAGSTSAAHSSRQPSQPLVGPTLPPHLPTMGLQLISFNRAIVKSLDTNSKATN